MPDYDVLWCFGRDAAAWEVADWRTGAVNEKMRNLSQSKHLVHDWDAIMTLASENGWTKEVDDMGKAWVSTSKSEEYDEDNRKR